MRPTKQKVAEHWVKVIAMSMLGDDGTLRPPETPREQVALIPAIDLGEPSCWACGHWSELWTSSWNTTDMHACHLIPDALGGSMTDPSNFVVLCEPCHIAAPDCINPDVMLQWIIDRPSRWAQRAQHMQRGIEKVLGPLDSLDDETLAKLAVVAEPVMTEEGRWSDHGNRYSDGTIEAMGEAIGRAVTEVA